MGAQTTISYPVLTTGVPANRRHTLESIIATLN